MEEAEEEVKKAQERVDKAEKECQAAKQAVDKAEKEYEDAKRMVTYQWLTKNGLKELAESYATSGALSISFAQQITLQEFLSQSEYLTVKENDLRLEKASLARKEESLARKEESLARKESILLIQLQREASGAQPAVASAPETTIALLSRKKVEKSIKAVASPSACAKSKELAKNGVKPEIEWHRGNRDDFVPDGTIIVEAFNEFLKSFQSDTLPVGYQFYKALEGLISSMPKFHKPEDKRTRAFVRGLQEMGFKMEAGRKYSIESNVWELDGVCFEEIEGFASPLPLMVLEVKNELGIGNSEALYQALIGAAKTLIEESSVEQEQPLGYPLHAQFILILVGPWLCVGGMYYGLNFSFDNLSGFLPIWDGSVRDTDTIARLFNALTVGYASLVEYYKSKRQQLKNELVPPFYRMLAEQYCLDKSLANKEIVYTEMIFNYVYKAKVDNRTVIVKFASKYSKEAHLACGRNAPQLLYYDDKTLHSYKFVVMEFMENYKMLSDLKSLKNEWKLQMEGTIKALHEKSLVHGDLRSTNILINETTDHLVFIDFDWAGTEGLVIYPAFVNNVNIVRPEEVIPGAKIFREHDIKALQIIYSFRSKQTPSIIPQKRDRE
jgi:serine/threonine protein kinase